MSWELKAEVYFTTPDYLLALAIKTWDDDALLRATLSSHHHEKIQISQNLGSYYGNHRKIGHLMKH
jgi:hypothetical protein